MATAVLAGFDLIVTHRWLLWYGYLRDYDSSSLRQLFTDAMSSIVGLGILSLLLTMATLRVTSRTAPTVHFASKPILLEVKTEKRDNQQTEKLSLRELVETRCPSLFTAFNAAWCLFKLVHSAQVLIITDSSKWTPPDYILRLRRFLKDRPCHLPKVVVIFQMHLHIETNRIDRKYLRLADGGTL